MRSFPEELGRQLIAQVIAGSAEEKIVGGNSTVHKFNIGGESVVAKDYRGTPNPRGRLRREWWALKTLSQLLPGLAPEPIWVSDAIPIAIHSFLSGTRPTLDTAGLAAMSQILEELHGGFLRSGDIHLEPAIDCAQNPPFLPQQIENRCEALLSVSEPDVSLLVADIQAGLKAIRLSTDRTEPSVCLTLSPSDFGVHNILCDEKLSVAHVIDLEFFGVDAVVKLIGDTVLHPQAEWTDSALGVFLASAEEIYAPCRVLSLPMVRLLCLKWSSIIARRAIVPDSTESTRQDKIRALELAWFYSTQARETTEEGVLEKVLVRPRQSDGT